MVAFVTTFGRNGVADFIVQRVTAVIMLAYTLCMLGFFLTTSEVDYTSWKALFQGTGMRVFTLFTLVSIAAHAWIGMWSVVTDYIKCARLRLALLLVIILGLLAFVVWAVLLLWGA